MKSERTIDPITMSVIQHRLEWINKEMGVAMLRTSMSPIFAEVHDFSCAICDWTPCLASQVDGVPTHTASAMIAARAVAEKFKEDINKGDVFIINDAYTGGTHLADITIIKPVFYEDELVFYTINRAHHLDVGGSTAGSYSPKATEIFHEGIRIPPLRIYRKDEPIEDLVDFIRINTRFPDLMLNDIKAQVGSCTVGERRLTEIVKKYGVKTIKESVKAIMDYAERRIRLEISKFKKGTFEGESIIDDDGFGASPKIKLKVTVTDENDVLIDFEGSAPQVKGPINSPFANTAQSVYLTLLTVVDPTIPHNEGAYRPIKIIAPKGSIVDCEPPAPVASCTLDTTCAIIDAMWQALSKTLPEKTPAGWSRWHGPAIVGIDPRNAQPYVCYAFNGLGGGGAIHGMDGWSHIGDPGDLGGLSAPNIESNETSYPHITEFYEFSTDSGGAGRWRGGLGVAYKIKMYDENPVLVMFGDGVRTKPYGLFGGKPGKSNRAILNEGTHEEKELPAKGIVEAKKGATYTIYSAGGGGWGNPLERDPELVRNDAMNGYISIESAKEDYGVVIDPSTYEIKKLLR
ncbi:MAG: hydantoinase B/oxoprolinase family protein [Candidatus Bathyarchaeia archaeon]